jgi:hypothetical protein
MTPMVRLASVRQSPSPTRLTAFQPGGVTSGRSGGGSMSVAVESSLGPEIA